MAQRKKKKVIIAISGGVDSSVAAKLLVDQGFKSLGIFLHFWQDPFSGSGGSQAENKCCSAKALMDARKVCEKIGIPLYTLNFSEVFKEKIVDYFLSEYKKGNTPNPCVPCNRLVKLGLLIVRARELGFYYIASGHYARRKKVGGQYKLFRARDKEKDQSYFLYTLTQEQLKHLLFPLGDYTKDEVRKIAKKSKLSTAGKKESQEICFIPEKSHNDFLKRYLKLKSGPIKALDGKTVGQHKGLPLYTIGQRRGVAIGGTGPFYVARCDYKKNILYVVKDGRDSILYNDKLIASDVNWIAGNEPKMPLKCRAVIRYRHKGVECVVRSSSPKRGNPKKKDNRANLYLVKFKKPQRAVTVGQSVVFYKGNEVLGGGIIKEK